MTKKKYERNLSQRDREILDFVARYRVGTDSMLKKSCFAEDSRIENVRRVLFRLEKRGLMRRVECGTTFDYFVMTRRGAWCFGFAEANSTSPYRAILAGSNRGRIVLRRPESAAAHKF